MRNIQIVFEDDVLLVCNKPAGLMVEPDRNNFPNLLQDVKNYLRESVGEKQVYVQHLHRLDRPVSGLVLFTKQKEQLRNLSEQFAQRKVIKHYQALTQNTPAELEGTLEHWHRKEKKKAVLYDHEIEFSEKAILKYSVKPGQKFFLWEIDLCTGKFHQIRAQLASLGSPVLGDELYGSVVKYRRDAIALCAYKLVVQHPVSGSEMLFEIRHEF